ncbi:hypothetical protein [Nonomuraea insulae]|uniref:NB-ARC domain-containing protein n=1 Tax=Nonomuraea insulae TaxID=1616787 RepID=A0ABW1CU18_9ACTN
MIAAIVVTAGVFLVGLARVFLVAPLATQDQQASVVSMFISAIGLIVSVAAFLLQVRAERTHTTKSGATLQGEAAQHDRNPSQPRSGQIVEGNIPQRPPGHQLREDSLLRLRELLDHQTSTAGDGAVMSCAVTGGPGVGKTMLVASYAWGCQAAGWPVIVWIIAEEVTQIVSGLASLADRLGQRTPDDNELIAAGRAKAWLATTTEPCLLVFDNALSVAKVRQWCPATGATRVIITSRKREFERAFEHLEVRLFSSEQSVAFLQDRTGLSDPVSAARLAVELGHLPLALAQAAAMITQTQLDYSEYLDQLRDDRISDYLQAQDGDAYPVGAAEAILLSVYQAEESLPFARRLLSFLAVSPATGVSVSRLAAEMGAELMHVRKLLADLTNTSLVAFSEDRGSVSMHRLVHRVLRDRAARQSDVDYLLKQAIGPPQQVEQFFHHHGRTLISVAMLAGATRDEADKAVRATMVALGGRWNAINDHKGYAGEMVLATFIKQRGKQPSATTITPWESRLTLWEDRHWIELMLDALPPTRWDTMACYLAGMTRPGISEHLGRKWTVVGENLRFARERLQQIVDRPTQSLNEESDK